MSISRRASTRPLRQPPPSQLPLPRLWRAGMVRPAGLAVALLATGGISGAAGCRAGETGGTRDGDGPRAKGIAALRTATTADDSTLVRAAESALATWLDASAEQPDATGSSVQPPNDCENSIEAFPSPLLAGYRLTGATLRGDTVVMRAVVTTVAEQDVDRRMQDRFVARQRVRDDELEWDVIPTDAGWMVCNGIRFGYRGADSLTRWMPDGASIQTARALADSIRRTRPSNARQGTS